MSRSIDSRRLDSKYDEGDERYEGDDDDVIYGEDAKPASGADAGMYAGIVSELVKNVSGIVTSEQDKKKASKDSNAAKDARLKATLAANEASSYAAKANAEQDPNGPLHAEARRLADRAMQLDTEARFAEAKLLPATYPGMPGQPPYGTPGYPGLYPQSQSMLTPRNVMIGLGIGLIGVIGYKLATKK